MSELNIVASVQNNRTVLSELYFTSPLKVAKPFYIDGANGKKTFTKVIVMQASAGLLDGDNISVSLSLEEGAALEYTGQSYTKVFNSPSGTGACQNTSISLSENSSLVFSPMPIVPFENSVYKADTVINLKKNSRLVYSDIFCCGRKERGEEFRFKSFCSRCRIKVDGKIAFMDNTRFFPEQAELDSIGFFEGWSHTGFIYLYGYDLPDYSSLLGEGISAADTECLEGILIRVFADSAERIRDFVSSIVPELKTE